MAIISIKNKEENILMPDINSAAAAVLYGKGLMLSIDFSDGQKPIIGPDCPLINYIPKEVKSGRFTFNSDFGWMYSLSQKVGDEWVDTYSGSFKIRTLNRLPDDPDDIKKYRIMLWPVDATGLPLGTNS